MLRQTGLSNPDWLRSSLPLPLINKINKRRVWRGARSGIIQKRMLSFIQLDSITLFIKEHDVESHSIVLDVATTATVDFVRTAIITRLGLDAATAQLSLLSSGQLLNDGQSLSDCGIQNNSTLHFRVVADPLEACRGPDSRTLKRGTWASSDEEDHWIHVAGRALRSSDILLRLAHAARNDAAEASKTQTLAASSDIPKIIHHIWLGSPRPSTPEYTVWFESWKLHHPDWEIRWWHDEDVRSMVERGELINVDRFNAASNYGEKSDILRYEILLRYGGLYVDTDMECVSSFEALHSSREPAESSARHRGFSTGDKCTGVCSFYVGWSNTGTIEINNGIIGSIPNHPILQSVVEAIQKQSVLVSKKEVSSVSAVSSLLAEFLRQESVINLVAATTENEVENNKWEELMGTIERTGPGLITRHVLRYMVKREEDEADGGGDKKEDKSVAGRKDPVQTKISLSPIIVLPMTYLYPVPNNVGVVTEQLRRNHVDSEKTLAIHHWAKSWQ